MSKPARQFDLNGHMGMPARHRELALRIEELLRGVVASIPELDDRPREVKGTGVGWRFLASGSTRL